MAKVEILNANGAVVSSADVMTNVNITGTGDSAKLKVYNGGYVSGGTIAGTSAGESFYVYAGGVMSGVTISYTSLYGTPTGIGGVLSGCTVEGKSFIVFGNGGKALDTVVNTDIRCDLLYAGAYASGTIIRKGSMRVYGGTRADDTTVSGGELEVYTGATLSGVTATGGSVTVSSGARLVGGSITGAATYSLAAGGVMENVTIGTKNDISAYGTFSGCSFISGGGVRAILENGGSAVDCTVVSRGRLDINGAKTYGSGNQIYGNFYLNNATFLDTTVYDGGSVNVLNGGVLDGATMSGGWVGARSGDVKNITILNGTLDVAESAGFSASKVTMSGGTVNVSRGGTVADVTMTGGTMTLASAAVASGVTMSGGTMNASSGATVSGVEMTAGTMKVSGGAVASGVTMTGGAVTVNATGKIYDLNMTGGNLTGWGLVSGGSITGTATFTVNTGAVFSGVTIGQNNGGSPAETGNQGGILSGCTITDDTFITFGGTGKSLNNVISGNYRIDLQNAGAYGSGNVIRKGGMKVSSGTTAHDTTVSGGCLELYVGGAVSGVTMTGGTVSMYTGAAASCFDITGGMMSVSSATASDVTMTGGTLNVSGGATVSGVTMTAGAVAISGGVISGLTANNGTVSLVSGGKLVNATLSDNAHYSLAGGTVFENVTLNLTYGTGTEGNTGYGTLSSCTIQNGGANNRTILTNGKAYDCTVAKGGRFDMNGDSVTGSGLQVYGDFYLNQGTFTDATFYSGGSVNILNYGTLDGATVSGGSVIVRTGDAKNVTMYDGTLDLQSAGHSATTVNVSGGTVKVSSGALLKDATFTGGTMSTYTGAVVSSASIQGGSVTTWGGTLKDYTLAGGVWTTVRGNTTLDGTVTLAGCVWIADSAYTITANNATIIFDTVNYKDINQGIVYYLEKFTGAKEFRVSVDGDTAYGHYALAVNSNVAAVNKDFVVYDGETELGTITLANSTANRFISGSKSYGMQLSSDRVYLLVQSGVADLKDSTIGDEQITFKWIGVSGATGYKVTVDGGTNWTDVGNVTTYTYNGSDTVGFMVKAYSDATHLGDASAEQVVASTDAAVDTLVSNAEENAEIVLRDGTYTGTGAITMKEGQTLEGQGKDNTTIGTNDAKIAIYGSGNAVAIKNLKVLTNVAGGAVNADAAATDLTVASALLTDAFAGSLVKSGTVEVTSAGAELTGTTFRNLYGAGYATGSTTMLTNSSVELNVSGGCTTVGGSGCIYGAGRVASGATLNVSGTVAVNVANGTASSGTLGGLYAGGYANGASVLNVASTNVAVKSGVFAKFVAAGVQVYGSGTTGTVTEANLTISGGEFNNAVLGASYAAGGASASVTSATTTISGGTFHGYVAGGGYVNASTLTVGDVDLTITGGTFTKYIFGGNLGGSSAAAGTVTNAVNLTLDATSNAIYAGIIYAGSMNSGTVGSTLVELKGEGENLSFSKLCGGGSHAEESAKSGVTNDRELKFTGFSGDLTGRLYDFDTFTMVGSTVAFAKAQDLTAVSTWNLDLTGTGVSADTALIDWSTKLAQSGTNDFDGDTMNLTFDTASTTDLLLITGDASLDLATDDMAKVTFNEVSAAKQDNGSWMANVGGVDWYLKNSTTDGVNNLVLTTIA